MSIFYTDFSRKMQPCHACSKPLHRKTQIVRIAEVGERYCRAFHPECARNIMLSEINRLEHNAEWDPNFKRELDQYRAERKMNTTQLFERSIR